MIADPTLQVTLVTLAFVPVLEVRNIGTSQMDDVDVVVHDPVTGLPHADLLSISTWRNIAPGAAVEFPMRRRPVSAVEVVLSWHDDAGHAHLYRCVIDAVQRVAEAPCAVPGVTRS